MRNAGSVDDALGFEQRCAGELAERADRLRALPGSGKLDNLGRYAARRLRRRGGSVGSVARERRTLDPARSLGTRISCSISCRRTDRLGIIHGTSIQATPAPEQQIQDGSIAPARRTYDRRAMSSKEGIATGLLERSGELAALSSALDAARLGDGRLVVIEGAAGIGKTCLLTPAASEPRSWTWSHCAFGVTSS